MASSWKIDDRRAGVLASPFEPPEATRIHYVCDGIRIASWRNLGVVHWGSRATRESVRALSAMSASLIKAYERISVVQVIPDNVGMPDDDVRRGMLKLVEVGAPSLACLVYVLGGDGFWASAVRGVITHVLAGPPRPFVARICTTVQEAAAWLPSAHAERTRIALEPSSLLSVLERVSTDAPETTASSEPGSRSLPRRDGGD